MTICFFSAQYLPTSGGVERYTDHLAKYAAEHGHTVIIVTSALPGVPERETTPEGIKIFRLPAKLCMQGRFPVPVINDTFRKLSRELWSKKIDFVVIQTRFYLLSLYASREAKKRNIPMMLIEHSTGHLVPNGKLAQFVGHIYEHMAARYLRGKCSHFYGVSNGVCEWLRHFGIRADGVLYNSVDVAEIDKILHEASENWHCRLHVPQETKLVLFAGRLIPEKGVQELIDAVQMLGRSDTVLLLAGSGPMLEDLRQRYENSEKIKVLGRLSYEDLLRLYARADVLCLPTSYSEGFPTVLLEGAACGCTEIASDAGGVREILPSEEYGIILPSTAPADIADALNRMLSDDAFRESSRRLLRQRVENNFDWPVTGRRFLTIAASVCGAKETNNGDETS